MWRLNPSYIQSSLATILLPPSKRHHHLLSTWFQYLSSLLPGHLDIERLDVAHQEIIRISTEVILDEASEIGVQIQQHIIRIPLWPVCEELAGAGVRVESVDEREVVGAESGGAVIWRAC